MIFQSVIQAARGKQKVKFTFTFLALWIYRYPVLALVRVVLLIGLAAREISYLNQSEALSHIYVTARHQYGISLLVPRASFRVASRNVGCILRLRRLRSSEILVSRSGSGKTKQITWHGDEQCDCCSRSLLLLTPTTWFLLVRTRNLNAKWESESERDRR